MACAGEAGSAQQRTSVRPSGEWITSTLDIHDAYSGVSISGGDSNREDAALFAAGIHPEKRLRNIPRKGHMGWAGGRPC